MHRLDGELLALLLLQLQEDHVAGHEDTFTAAEKCPQRLVVKLRGAVVRRVGVGDAAQNGDGVVRIPQLEGGVVLQS